MNYDIGISYIEDIPEQVILAYLAKMADGSDGP